MHPVIYCTLGTYLHSVQFIFVGWKKGHVEWSFQTWEAFGHGFNVEFCFLIILKFWFTVVYQPHAAEIESITLWIWEERVCFCIFILLITSGSATFMMRSHVVDYCFWLKYSIYYTAVRWFSSFPRYTVFSNSSIKRRVNRRMMHIKTKNNLRMLCLFGPRVKWHSRDRRPYVCFLQPLWILGLCGFSLT